MTAAVSPAVRHTTTVSVVVVALVAAVVSYSHVQELTERAGEEQLSYLIPLSIDGLVVAGSMALLTRRRKGLAGGWTAWGALVAGVVASLAANMAAAEPNTTARLVAAWPAAAFAVAFELLLQQRRADRPEAPVSAAEESAPVEAIEQPAPEESRSDPVPTASAPTISGASRGASVTQLPKPRQATAQDRRRWIESRIIAGHEVTGRDVEERFGSRNGAREVAQVVRNRREESREA